VEQLINGMGKIAESGVSSEGAIAVRSSWETIAVANGRNSKRETFWKGSGDAGLFAIEQQLKSRLE
jgi:hypothetical protein